MSDHDEKVPTVPRLPRGSANWRQPVKLGMLSTFRVLAEVVVPVAIAGLIKRRPRWMKVAEKLQLDGVTVRRMQRLRAKYGKRPVLFRFAGRSVQLPLDAGHVGDVLADTPDPFSPATVEKVAALRQFQPHGVLISTGASRDQRRDFNEVILQPDRELHGLAPRITGIVHQEARDLAQHAIARGELDWGTFAKYWWAAVRRIVLGDSARTDHVITDRLASLRGAGNWAYLVPRRLRLRERFLHDVTGYVERAERGSLAALVRETEAPWDTDRAGQLPHWLFACDAAGIVTLRALALLAGHPVQAAEARAEIAPVDLERPHPLPYLRACVLESVRLWPTTPALLRETVRDTGEVATGTTVFVCTGFFHRDSEELPFAHSFAPDIWLDGTAREHPALVPFSAGNGQCPGRHVVLLVASTMLAALLRHCDVELAGQPQLETGKTIPYTLDNFGLRFTVRA
ncbi:cytochrome P450 [Tamaricihabitans halophyticus]|uniref:Cytochrome P450 n=1 Tax=Tamaricihabitans halophyticus TaxID=1262583 RepID=A0A4R2Q4G0_9PSEU|nr:cytochrome P450 [Tamaricihabitans halophyticus]TCP42648.1 cytochrome P450 [Tamaricihabitans halophyticus]